MYGTLPHSHLHQVLKNVAAGVTADVSAVASRDGTLSLQVLRMKDSAFANAVDSGMLWEVLSWKMDVEEPSAAGIIQSALNSKNAIALLVHEMQCIAAICRIAPAVAGGANCRRRRGASELAEKHASICG